MQLVHHYIEEAWHELTLPPAGSFLAHMPGVKWGSPGSLFSPSFWRFQHWVEIELRPERAPRCRFGEGGLLEEVVACVLGGHGLPAETSIAYFERFKAIGLLNSVSVSLEEVEGLLKEPVKVGGSMRRYRFWRSKARAVWAAMSTHRSVVEQLEASAAEPREFRDRLTELPGVGLKTASWICRNWLANDDVAVLDVHILRSLSKLGCPIATLHKAENYYELEKRFLSLSRSLGTPTRTLDLVMWAMMRQLS